MPMKTAMNTLHIIVAAIGLQLLCLAFLLVATLVTQARRSEGKSRELEETWCLLLPAALAGQAEATGQIQASIRSRAGFESFHRSLDAQLHDTGSRSRLAVRRLCREVGFTDRLLEDLVQSRDPLSRAAAAKTLGRLREKTALETALDLLHADDPAVVLAAADAITSLHEVRQFLPVFRAVYGRTPITLHGAAGLLSGFGSAVCPVIHRLLIDLAARGRGSFALDAAGGLDPEKSVGSDDVAAQVVMVDLLAFYGYLPAAPTLLRLLRTAKDDEVLIHLVKALAKVGNSAAFPGLSELLAHSNWVVRSQGAEALSALHALGAVPYIRPLLDDESPAVRACAQRALASLNALEAESEADVVEVFA
jgi:hypothetical protein